jgi:spermidine/putrescine transport system permease protein
MKWMERLTSEELPFLLACPALVWQVFFIYAPLGVMLYYSFTDPGIDVGIWGLTLSHYRASLNPLYLKTVFNSFVIASATALCCLVLGYPVAYHLAFKARRSRTPLLFFLILPSWTSLIVQIYAWFFLLQKNGVFSILLWRLGLTREPIQLLNNWYASLVGMVYCFLPFMTLPLYATLERIDQGLLEASADLGASRWQTLRHVVFPLSLPGVAAGLLLVFIPSFGEYAVPVLLGGSKEVFWSSLIVTKFVGEHDFHGGAALAYVGVALLMGSFFVMVMLKAIYRWVARRRHNRTSDTGRGSHLRWGTGNGGR